MSDFRAIGGVSATLRTLLLDRMELPDGIANVPVTIGPPPFSAKADAEPHRESPQVNLFLYRVTENGYLQNQEIPGRGAPSAFGHPPLSVNLHYLITAYGNESLNGDSGPFLDLYAHYLLGSAMRVFHDVPIVTDAVITARPPSGRPVLDESLRGEFEKVKLSLETLTLEDITKIWSALVLRFRLSAAYVVNVVQIESRRPRLFPRPVGQPASATIPPLPTDPPAPGPMVYVRTVQVPTVTALLVRREGETTERSLPYARIGDTLILLGTSLAGVATGIGFGDLTVPASFVRGDRVEALIPDDSLPGLGPIPVESRLQPGARTACVVASDPHVPQSASRSNEIPFMLVPRVASLAYAGGPPRQVTIAGSRLIPPGKGGETVVGRSVVPRDAYLSEREDQLVVPIPETLPSATVPVSLSTGGLAPSITLTPGVHMLDVTINGTTRPVSAQLPGTLDRDAVPGIVAGLVRDALPSDPRFAGARAGLFDDGGSVRLAVVAGGLAEPISFASSSGSLANDLGLPSTPPAAVGYASGLMEAPPSFSSANPQVSLRIGTQPAVTISVPVAATLRALAASLQSTISGSSTASEYADAKVAAIGGQLLVIPGTATGVSFAATAADDTTVAELQLRARFAIRVRANGAESVDEDALLELPQP